MTSSPRSPSGVFSRSDAAEDRGCVVGVVGGVGSGKSAVANAVCLLLKNAEQRASLLDGDRVGHETLTRPEVIEQLTDAFGPSILDKSQAIDRRALAGLVFGTTDEHDVRRRDLEAIMHPTMRALFEARMAESAAGGEVVLFDAAVLFEAGWDDLCHAAVFVDVPEDVREQRALARGWTTERWRQTEASQWPLDKKRAAVEHFPEHRIVSNTGPLKDTASELTTWVLALRSPLQPIS